MIKYFSVLILAFLSVSTFAQEKVELIEERTEKEVILKAFNHFPDQAVKLVVVINSVGFGLKKEETFTKTIPANSEALIVTMVPTPNRQCTYSAELSYTTKRMATTTATKQTQKAAATSPNTPRKSTVSQTNTSSKKPTQSTPAVSPRAAQKSTVVSKKKSNPLEGKKGIVVYSKDGCGRCDFVTDYLEDNNIKFEYLNISKDPKADEQMGKVLFASGFKGGSFTTPLVTVDDKAFYNIKDLRSFVAGLK